MSPDNFVFHSSVSPVSFLPSTIPWPLRISALRRLLQRTPAPPSVRNRRSFRRLSPSLSSFLSRGYGSPGLGPAGPADGTGPARPAGRRDRGECDQPTRRPARPTSQTVENALRTGVAGSVCAHGHRPALSSAWGRWPAVRGHTHEARGGLTYGASYPYSTRVVGERKGRALESRAGAGDGGVLERAAFVAACRWISTGPSDRRL